VDVRQYILEKKRADIGGEFNLGILMLCILVILAGVVGVICIVKWLQKRKERKKS
jgi:hypothetical protein